ncbi:MAG TPA: SDR family oxidoreductase [Pirellulaceae bacterium]|nr:SDR family oxidoreductase [Pirellulaceae bacterium]
MNQPEDFLRLAGKRIVVFGVANKKSVAWHVGQMLEAARAEVIYVVRSPQRAETIAKWLPGRSIYVCDVEFEEQIAGVAQSIQDRHGKIAGLVHSIAFADYSAGMKPFHETGKAQFLRTVDISCFSLIAIAHHFQDVLESDASVVTVSISTTRMANENYGFMAPVKAALESSLAFLAKSFSSFSKVRFNAVAPGLLKTSASAGIPGYVDAYLYAERVIPRGEAVTTPEAASVVCFLLSPRASGINAQSLVVDAGMSINYFDTKLIQQALS